jgi:hypothetical protein
MSELFNFKVQLIEEWMKENPPFEDDKISFEDFLVLELKKQDANQAIQLDEKEKVIRSLENKIFRLESNSREVSDKNIF